MIDSRRGDREEEFQVILVTRSGKLPDHNKIFFSNHRAENNVAKARRWTKRVEWREDSCEFRGSRQSNLWETNTGYKITLPIQIGKLMVVFAGSLFDRRATMAGLLSYRLEMAGNFKNVDFRGSSAAVESGKIREILRSLHHDTDFFGPRRRTE